ncbi:MAG: hypothetical protein EBR02_10175 [Alphaproteobacteria bacterium]|nr:hypothetical protein [Alphaproteobacteria bacterium]
MIDLPSLSEEHENLLEPYGTPHDAVGQEKWYQIRDSELFVLAPSDGSGLLIAVDPELEQDIWSCGTFIAKEELGPVADFFQRLLDASND